MNKTESIELEILKEFESCKQQIKENASPKLYYLLLELKDNYKLKGVNYSSSQQ